MLISNISGTGAVMAGYYILCKRWMVSADDYQNITGDKYEA
ncbi:hypothetical protein ACLBKY_14295 [Bacillus altitudinis]